MSLQNENSGLVTDQTEQDYIDLRPVIERVFHYLWLIILITIICGVAAFLVIWRFIPSKYTATFTTYINNNTGKMEKELTTVANGDLVASKSLSATYAQLLKSYRVYEAVNKVVPLNFTYEDSEKAIEVIAETSTGIITVAVTTKNPEYSRQIAQAMTEVCPEIVSDVVEGSSMKIVDIPRTPQERSGPSYFKWSAAAAAAGFLTVMGTVIWAGARDDRIKTISDFERRTGIVVIGSVHDLRQVTRRDSSYGKYYQQYSRYNRSKRRKKD